VDWLNMTMGEEIVTYINVGAKIDTVTDGGTEAVYVRTKTALRTALRDNPSAVLFESTEAIGGNAGATFRGDEIPEGVRLQVCGPDPYTSRKWYATAALKNGTPKLS
jgi:hypothetical protein